MKTKFDEAIVRTARTNHIWLNAFACVSPTKEFKIALADQVLDMLNDRERLIYDDQDSKNEHIRALGKLTPQLIVRINKS